MEPFKTSESQRAEVVNLVHKWGQKLGLENWKIQIDYLDGPHPECEETAAEMGTQAEYVSSNLRVYPRFFGLSPMEREETIVHELVHCLVEPLSDDYHSMLDGEFVTPVSHRKRNEEVTSRIAGILMRLNEK